jgi:hypothetical protein
MKKVYGIKNTHAKIFLLPETRNQIALIGQTIFSKTDCGMPDTEKLPFFLEVRVCPTLT